MLATILISFREFLEAFLIAGVFLGISKKLQLKREKAIITAIILGVTISLILPIIVFAFGERAGVIINEKNAEFLEGYLMVFSGIFLAYVVLSLHNFFVLKRSKVLLSAHRKLEHNIFDAPLFLSIVFFIVREGFEIALFTATTSLFTEFIENLLGLLIGFGTSLVFGIAAFFTYLKLPLGKVFKATEYLIILLGAALVKNGIGELSEGYFGIHLSDLLPIKLSFLPAKTTFVGQFLKTMVGIEQNFSIAKLAIMALYVFCLYFLLIRKKQEVKIVHSASDQ